MSTRLLFLIAISLPLSSCLGMGLRTPAPVVHYGQNNGAGSAGVHNVVSGDTLYSISRAYRLPMRDIAIKNHLKPPFKLYEGQRLRLPNPKEYKVQSGDTLYGIARLFGVSSSEITRLNNLQPPYIVRVGQVLRLPSATRKDVRKSTARKDVDNLVSKSGNNGSLPVQNSEKPATQAVIKDGVPVPQSKPEQYVKPKSVHVSKVRTKAPKRASSKFLRPVRGKIISNYGAKKSGLHNDGINIAAPRGAPVKAAENGVVVYAGNALKGSGNLILVRHENQWMSAYAHLDKILVRKGQIVKRGAQIGKVGSTGNVSKPQLHFEIRRATSAMNPVKYME